MAAEYSEDGGTDSQQAAGAQLEDFAAAGDMSWQGNYGSPMMQWYSMSAPQCWPVQSAASSNRWQSSPSSYQGGAFVGGGGRAPAPQKQRFCATYPDIGRCRHGPACAFAHSREEITAPLLKLQEEACCPEALTESFFTERFKTLWCPIGAQHDWQACMYAHTYQDARRPPSIGYGHQLCPYWNKKDVSLAYAQRCPLGPRCPYAHGAKEQLYHPQYFRTLVCRDLQRRRCPRGVLCAFFHRQDDMRKCGPDLVDYTNPLPKEALEANWLAIFLSPPRFQESAGEDGGMIPEAMMPGPIDLTGLAVGTSKWMEAGLPALGIEAQEDEETTAEEEGEGGVPEDSGEESIQELGALSLGEARGGWPGSRKNGRKKQAEYAAAVAEASAFSAGPEAAAWAAAAAGAEEWGAYYGYAGVYGGNPGWYMDASGMYMPQNIWDPSIGAADADASLLAQGAEQDGASIPYEL